MHNASPILMTISPTIVPRVLQIEESKVLSTPKARLTQIHVWRLLKNIYGDTNKNKAVPVRVGATPFGSIAFVLLAGNTHSYDSLKKRLENQIRHIRAFQNQPLSQYAGMNIPMVLMKGIGYLETVSIILHSTERLGQHRLYSPNSQQCQLVVRKVLQKRAIHSQAVIWKSIRSKSNHLM